MKIKRPLINPNSTDSLESMEVYAKPKKRNISVNNNRKSKKVDFFSNDSVLKIADKIPLVSKEEKAIEKDKKLIISEDQLNFEITPKKPNLSQRLNFLKYSLKKRQEVLEISIIWKNPAFPFTLVSLIFLTLVIFIGGIFEFDKMPSKIPLFYNHLQKTWEQTDKSTIFILGIGLLATETILINLLIKIFNKDRRLALTLSWICTYVNVLILIAILQIYSLIT